MLICELKKKNDFQTSLLLNDGNSDYVCTVFK